MKKIILSMLLVLTACGGSGNSTDKASSDNAADHKGLMDPFSHDISGQSSQ